MLWRRQFWYSFYAPCTTSPAKISVLKSNYLSQPQATHNTQPQPQGNHKRRNITIFYIFYITKSYEREWKKLTLGVFVNFKEVWVWKQTPDYAHARHSDNKHKKKSAYTFTTSGRSGQLTQPLHCDYACSMVRMPICTLQWFLPPPPSRSHCNWHFCLSQVKPGFPLKRRKKRQGSITRLIRQEQYPVFFLSQKDEEKQGGRIIIIFKFFLKKKKTIYS